MTTMFVLIFIAVGNYSATTFQVEFIDMPACEKAAEAIMASHQPGFVGCFKRSAK